MTEEVLKSHDRRITSLEGSVKSQEDRIVALERRDAVAEIHYQGITTRLDAIEDGQKWLNRTIWGAALGGFVLYILQNGLSL